MPLSEQTRKTEREKISISIEIVSILSFLLGLALLTALAVGLATTFANRILPQDIPPSMLLVLFPGHRSENWLVVVGSLSFLLPAGLLMSAGVVLRRFLRS